MTKEQIRKFVLDNFPLARSRQIEDHTALLDEGILDSMGILELVDFLESELQLEAEAEDLVPENFGSIDAIAAFVEKKVPSTKPA